MQTIKSIEREVKTIHREEDLYPFIAVGAMDREAARFLASHPKILKKWRGDIDYLQHLLDDIHR